MVRDNSEIYKAADDRDGCGISEKLLDIPVNQHLQIIQDLKNHIGKGPLDVQIAPGSTATNFEFSILNSAGPRPSAEIAKLLGTSVEKLEKAGAAARNGLPPVEIVHERIQSNPSNTGVGLDSKAKLDCRTN